MITQYNGVKVGTGLVAFFVMGHGVTEANMPYQLNQATMHLMEQVEQAKERPQPLFVLPTTESNETESIPMLPREYPSWKVERIHISSDSD